MEKTIQELLEFGIINVDKPAGMTSFDVVDEIRKTFNLRKTSHFGTLDPMVTGVLPIALNRSCKLTGFFISHDKEYVGEMKIHEDIELEKIKEMIKEKFLGKIIQLPPVKSRVKRQEREREIMKFDLSLLEDTGFKSFLFGFLCEYEDEYLIKSHPQAESDFFNLPSGQPRLGEPMNEALVRSFNDNVGIKVKPANFKFLSLHIKTIKTSKSETMFDDAFVIYKTTINKEQKNNMKLHKQVSWMSLDKIKKLNNRWPEINDLILSEDTNPYKAYEFTSDYIL